MSKNKYVVIGGSSLLVVVGLVVGLVVWHGKAQATLHSNVLSYQSGSGSDSVALGQPTGDDSISLNPANRKSSADSGGLSVTSDGGTGQLGGSNGQSLTGNSTNSGSEQSNPFDPSTYAQYDKYKSGDSAMFADVVKGTGDELTANKKAAVYYKGWLTDGTLFDQSQNDSSGKLQPFIFTLGAHTVIPGWEEALDGMKVGGVRLLIVPPSVGYGAAGQGPIPGNAVLIFQVQLAAVQ